MKKGVAHLAFVFGLAGAISIGCGSDDDATPPNRGGAGGSAGSAGKAGSGGKGGSSGKAGSGNESGSAGELSPAGSAGIDQGGAAGAAGDTAGGEGGGAGAAPIGYTPEQIERGKVIVRSTTLCGSCHTATGGGELAGNPAFAGNLGASEFDQRPFGHR